MDRKMSSRQNRSLSIRHKYDTVKSVVTKEDFHNYPLFCEISELRVNYKAEKRLWRESARLVKYLETVDDNGAWSKPHVSTIVLHHLGELRYSLGNGTVIFNCEAHDFDSVVDSLTAELINDGNLDAKYGDKFKETLSYQHIHQYQKEYHKEMYYGRKNKIVKKKQEEAKAEVEEKPKIVNRQMSFTSTNSLTSGSVLTEELDDDISMISYDSNFDEMLISESKIGNSDFRKKIPEEVHAANFMVGSVDFLREEVVALVELKRPVVMENLAEVNIPTKYIFIALSPKKGFYKMQQLGRCCATLFSDELFQSDLNEIESKEQLVTALDSFLDQATVIPPGEWDTSIRLKPPSKVPSKAERLLFKKTKKIKADKNYGGHEDDPCLSRTGKFCGGLINDIKRKLPWYVSDFTDILNFQCVSAIGFLYFACLTPIITFGGLLGFATDNNMGAIESLVAGLIVGVAYALFSGQPMTIMGSTGPVLVFETILNTFSKANGIDYMGFRVWVGLWITFFLIIICVTDLSFIVQYITRFTEELFALLIAVIFVHESFDKLLKIRHQYRFTNNPYNYTSTFTSDNEDCFKCLKTVGNSTEIINGVVSEFKCESLGNDHHFVKNCENIPDVFFFSVILYLLTFIMAMGMRHLKSTGIFSTGVRQKLSNFGVVATILTMVYFDHIIGLDTPKLHVPKDFHPTIADRGWFINPIERQGDKWWLCFAAIVPALLATVLIFMDQQITTVIINRASNKLKKSAGYHLDLLVCGICISINSIFGLPWFVAATVLSMNHVIALRKLAPSNVPGEPPKLSGVIEQRVTGLIIFSLVGLSIFATDYLKHIPMPVLYAIFMYMGVTPMGELELYKRICLLFMPKKHQPDYIFTRHVRLYRVHLFTFIQIICLIILYGLKMNKTISITFPMMVVCLVFIRFALNYVFTDRELNYLDDILPALRKKKEPIETEIVEAENVTELLEKDKRSIVSFNSIDEYRE